MRSATTRITSQSDSALLGVVQPVLAGMRRGALKDALTRSFVEEEESLRTIEGCFVQLTSKRHGIEPLKYFFQSWSQTNNSAASVSGLASRITLAAMRLPDNAAKFAYFSVVSSLQRITDEDLGAYGGVLHSDLYYRMATTICGDDAWLSKRYCLAAADEFRAWRDHQRLRERDLLNGLLHTLIHEVYTHGEVEIIHPICQAWLPAHMEIPVHESRKVLAWITVHTGGTESNHFRHATDAVEHYGEAAGVPIDPAAAKDLFKGYLRRKAAAMEELTPLLQ